MFIKSAVFALLTFLTVNTFCQITQKGIFNVQIKSTPDSADCFIDSVYRGKTPLEINLSGEPILLEFRCGGFADRKKIVSVVSDTIINEQLSRPSTLKVTSNPLKSTVFMNDEFAGTTPLIINGLDSDTVNLKVQRNKYDLWTANVPVKGGSDNEISAVLNIKTSRVNIYAEPANSMVYIDDFLISQGSVTNHEVESGARKLTIVNNSLNRKIRTNFHMRAGQEYSFQGTFGTFSTERAVLCFLLPGYAQFSDGAWLKGAGILAGSIVTVFLASNAAVEYNDRLSSYESSMLKYLDAKTETEASILHELIASRKKDLDQYYSRRTMYFSLFAAVYVYSIIDAFLNHMLTDRIELIVPHYPDNALPFHSKQDLGAEVKIKF